MGYRSQVRISTTREGYDSLCKHVDELSEASNDCRLVGAKREPEFLEEENGCVVLGWNDIKWYEDTLPDVMHVVSALDKMDEEGFPFEFCRVGESFDDIEFFAFNDNETLSLHVYPNVSIDILS